MNIPNALTWTRVALIPVLVVLFYLPFRWAYIAAAAVFALAALTDWLDGFLARQLEQTSRFGAFLDPVADKLMVAVVLVLLVQADPRMMMAIPAAIIIGREIAVSALREFMAELGQRATVAVALVGKLKTVLQMTALVLMLLREPLFDLPVYTIGMACLYAAVLMTLWSMAVYVRAAWPMLRAGGPGDPAA